MHIFINGHGGICLDKPYCLLPKNCTLYFYCYPSGLLPSVVADDILASETPKSVQTIKGFHHYPHSFLKCLNNDGLLQQRSERFYAMNKPNSLLVYLDQLISRKSKTSGRSITLQQIINIYLKNPKHSHSSHFHFHWVTCRKSISLNTAGGAFLGFNHGFHLFDPRAEFRGAFMINPRDRANRWLFRN